MNVRPAPARRPIEALLLLLHGLSVGFIKQTGTNGVIVLSIKYCADAPYYVVDTTIDCVRRSHELGFSNAPEIR